MINAVRRGLLPVAAPALLALLVTGCGAERADDDTGARAPGGAVSARPSASGAPADVTCPGETPTPTPTATVEDPAMHPPGDHYAENHGFMNPLPLRGQARCAGLAAAARIEEALEPLRTSGDFDPAHTRAALTRLGYDDAGLRVYPSGPTAVGFLIDDSGMCLEGAMNREATRTDAFGGYPDHTGCDRPSGGH